MMAVDDRSCLNCTGEPCEHATGDNPDYCLGGSVTPEIHEEVRRRYLDPEIHAIYEASVRSSALCSNLTRVQEIIEFARGLGVRKIGLASCTIMLNEARTFARILRDAGFETYGVACKIESNHRSDLAVHVSEGSQDTILCNPIMQARLLEEAGTELNVVVGLCVGHDALFYKHSAAVTTTLAGKDHITMNNPCAALYGHNSIYRKRIQETVDACRADLDSRPQSR